MRGSEKFPAFPLIGVLALLLARSNFVLAQKEGKAPSPGPVAHEIAAASAKFQSSTYTRYMLTLDKALESDRSLMIHLGHQDGEFRQAWATVSPRKDVRGTVDASRMELEGDTLKGEVRATIQFPEDRHSYSCTYTIQATLEGSNAAGSFKGEYGVTGTGKVSGAVSGELQARAEKPELVSFDLDLGQPLIGPAATWQRRVAVTFT